MLRFSRHLLLVAALLWSTSVASAQVEETEPDEESEPGVEGESEEEESEEESEPQEAGESEQEGELEEEFEEELEEPEAEPEPLEPYEPAAEPSTPRTICHGRMIRNVRVEGSRRVDSDDIRATMRLRRELPCTDDEVARDARALWDLGFFDDVIFEAVPAGNSVDLVIRVVERPAIARIVFDGNDEVDDDDIEEKVTLREGGILSIPAVRRQITKVRDLYAEEGYFLARVDYEIVRVANDNNEVEVRFHIDEGEEVTVRRVRFVGNRNIDSDELQGIMSTSETGFFSFISDDDTFDSDKFDEDVVRLQAWYYDKGYLSMNVGTPRIEMTPDRRYIDITIPITEGPRFKIGEMTVVEVDDNGEAVEALEDDLRDSISLDQGDWFSRSSIALGLQEITRVYRDAGFARVEVSPETQTQSEERIVDVTIQIVRGPPVRIERINIRGNTKTRDSVIRREMQILEGELYSQSDIEFSKNRVTALGYFERVDISEETGSRPDLMVLNVEVSERPTGTFQVGAGFSSIEQFILTAQIQQNNLFGRGQSLSLQLQISGIRQLVQLSFVEPWLWGTRWSGSGDFFLTQRQFQDFVRNSRGFGVGTGHPILDQRLRLFVGYRFESISIDARTGGLLGATGGGQGFQIFQRNPLFGLFRSGITSSLRLSLSWDSRDNRMFASNGWYAQYTAEIADRFLGSEQIFVRQNAFVRFYKQIWGPLVFKVNVEGGLITSRVPNGVPIFERYFLGGIFNVRGFQLNSLGPRGSIPPISDPNAAPRSARNGLPGGVPLGGNLQFFYQAELEFPIVKEVGIRGVLFTDGGNVWNLDQVLCQAPETSERDPTTDPCGVNPFALRTSVGFGFRWFSPLGPLRFEWGIPLARRSHEKKIDFQFTIGNSF